MNKAELIAAVADNAGMTAAEARRAVDAVTEVVMKTVKAGGDVTLVGFGTFSLASRAARQGRNPRTGESMKIAAAKVPRFSPGRTFKELVN